MTLGCSNDSTYSKNWVWRQTIVLACSEPKFQFHSLKLSLASYYPSTLFLSFRSIWGSWKWSQLITHTQKHWVWHQNQVYQSNNFTPWSCSWPLTAPPHCSWPLDTSETLECDPKWFLLPKNICFDVKIKSLVCSEPKLQNHSLKLSLASNSPSTLFLTFRSIWGSSKWSQMIPHIQNHWVRHPNQLYSPFCTCSSPDPPNQLTEALGRNW